MDETQNSGLNGQEIAEPDETGTTEASVSAENAECENGEAAKPQQSAEENASFADRRRKEEIQNLRKQLKESQQANNRYSAAYDGIIAHGKKQGYTGTPEEIADKVMADLNGQPYEEYLAERQKTEEESRRLEQLKNLEAEAIEYRKIQDLQKIQAVYPEVKSIEELGGEYLQQRIIARNAGMEFDPVLAYEVIQARRNRVQPPKSVGSMKDAPSGAAKEFYDSDELDSLTPKDLDNPKVLEKAMRSLGRLKKKG